MILSTACDNYLLLFMTKGKQVCILFQKHCFNSNIGVNGCADPVYVRKEINAEISKILDPRSASKRITLV